MYALTLLGAPAGYGMQSLAVIAETTTAMPKKAVRRILVQAKPLVVHSIPSLRNPLQSLPNPHQCRQLRNPSIQAYSMSLNLVWTTAELLM
jgi:hypothetical protein